MTFKRGDKIKLNRQLSDIEIVLSVTGNIIETYSHNTYHVTKVVKA